MIKQKQFFFSNGNPTTTKHIWILLKQHSAVEYLGCYLDSNLNEVSMAHYLPQRLLCNVLIQPHFDYRCTPWYPLLSKALKTKLQVAQNKCIRFCLEFPPHDQIKASHFRKINWLPVECRVELCTSTTFFKYWKRIAPSYLNYKFMSSLNKYN